MRDSIGDRLVWCGSNEEEIRSILAEGETLDRAVMVLNDPVLEAGTRGILTQVYGTGQPVEIETKERGSWVKKIFHRRVKA